jgi:predicted glycoside hydrolase/deacetylase ChbG (UPF0249 family)
MPIQQTQQTNNPRHVGGPPGSWRRISICLDDFGHHSGVNQAALALARAGRVQALSAMVGAPAWGAGAQALRAGGAGEAEVGLHLDLTEHPLHPALRLPLPQLVARAYLGQLDAAALRAEIRAQLDAFEHHLGRPPAYVDGHQHVHQLPVVRGLLVDEVVRRYPVGTLWLRATHAGMRRDVKSQVIAALGARGLAALAHRAGLPQNGRLLGVYGFTGGPEQYRERLAHWLQVARDGDLLMCHARLAGPGTAPPFEQAMQAEFAVLSGPQAPTLLAQAHVRLRPMREILSLAGSTPSQAR